MEIRPLREHELPQALALVWRVFLEFEAPEYPAEGVEEFRRSIADPAYLSQLRCYGAFAQDTLLGVMATRCAGSHVALFFVDAAHHHRGIGKALFARARKDCPQGRMTVNAAPYAVGVYEHLGFRATDQEQITNWLRYTPMEYQVGENGGKPTP